jgi:MraZ protein
MFLGQYRHNIDTKGRLTVPARFRELLGDGAYVTAGFDNNLMVLTERAFEAIQKRISQTPFTDPNARLLRRLLFSDADRVSPDKAGRILLPGFLREKTALGEEAVLVGVGDYFEIWSPEEWARQSESLGDTESNAQRFIGLELSAAAED